MADAVVIGLGVVGFLVFAAVLVWAHRVDTKNAEIFQREKAERHAKLLGEYILSPNGYRHRIVKETRMDGAIFYRVQYWHDKYKSQEPEWINCNPEVLPPRATLEMAQADLEKFYTKLRAQLVASQAPVLPPPEPPQ
jgi:hypothetical protein